MVYSVGYLDGFLLVQIARSRLGEQAASMQVRGMLP